MSNSKRSSSSRKKTRKLKSKIDGFTKSVGLSPMRLLVSAVLLLGIGYLIFSVAFSNRDDANSVATPSEMNIKQEELSLDRRLDAMLTERTPPKQNFLATIERMYEIDDELETIEANSGPSDSQKVTIDRIRLRNKTVVYLLMKRNKVPCDAERADLLQFCSDQLESSDEVLKEGSQFWCCVVPTVEFADSPSDETRNEYATALKTHSEGYLNTPGHASRLCELMLTMSKTSPNAKEYWKSGFSILARQLETSELESVRAMAGKLDGLELFVEFDLPTLAHRILWGEPSAPGDLEGAFNALATNPDCDMKHWVTILRAYEGFLSTDKIEETGSAWQRMSELSAKIPDPKKRKGFQDILARQRTRAMAIGSQFDPSGTLEPDGKPFGLGDQDYTAIIFCDKSKKSFATMVKLGAETKDSQLRYRPVLAFENELTQVDIESLSKVPRDIAVADHETSKRYFEALPVDFFPYVILLDKTGKIVASNLDVQQVPTRVAKFDANERKARAALNNGVDGETLPK